MRIRNTLYGMIRQDFADAIIYCIMGLPADH
jgi:hypothetical protein